MLPSMKTDELADFINFLGLIVHKLQVCAAPRLRSNDGGY